MIKVGYPEFKAYAIMIKAENKVKYIEAYGVYYMALDEGGLELSVELSKSNPLEAANVADFEANLKMSCNKVVNSTNPFASKMVGDKKLYERNHGKSFTLAEGDNTLEFTIPYALCKITGIEVINGEAGDTIDMFIVDDSSGTYSTIPNYTLNQFGFKVNVAKDKYKKESKYDADLYTGMAIKIVYNSVSIKNIGVNYNLHELKD